jgi:Rieske Fe-S protein
LRVGGRRVDTLQVIIKWRGKPVFIRHRTASEIDEANSVNVASLRDPQSDEERVKKPEWLVMLGMLQMKIKRKTGEERLTA